MSHSIPLSYFSDLFLIYFRTLASPASLAVVGFISDPPLSFIDAPGNLFPLNTCMYIVSLWTNLIFSYPYFLQVILHCLRHPGGLRADHTPTIRSFHSIHQHFATNSPGLEQYQTGNDKASRLFSYFLMNSRISYSKSVAKLGERPH